MLAAEDNDAAVVGIYIYRGGEAIPRHVTHVYVVNLSAVPAGAFSSHPNIEEVICHDGVEKIEQYAFSCCPRLRRVVMPGMKFLREGAFYYCRALTYIECGNLERIGAAAFRECKSLSSIDLSSIKIVEDGAFLFCTNLTNAKLGKDLEAIRSDAFHNCHSLERITFPLKNGMMTGHNIFQGCGKLNHIDLVGGVHETIAALLLEEWKNDMKEKIYEINRILPNTRAGNTVDDLGGKVEAIQAWIRPVLHKIIHYKAEHQRILGEAASTLQSALPNDIVFKNVLAFLELPSYTFDGEN